MFRRLVRASAVGALFAGFLAVSAQAANIDPADIAFWQSVQDAKNPAEYQSYLNAFPNGVFVDLAKVRIQEYSGAPDATAAPPSTADAPVAGPALGPVVGKGIITVTPATAEVGQQIMLTFANFPTPGSYDMIAIMPAGTPDAASSTSPLAYSYINQNMLDNGYKVGPFAPGTYETRWLTTLYNNEKKVQVGARTQFSVSP